MADLSWQDFDADVQEPLRRMNEQQTYISTLELQSTSATFVSEVIHKEYICP